MATDNMISDVAIKSFPKISKYLSAADQIILETKWTDYLQNLVDLGNSRYLNFSLKLELEYDHYQGRV
jgi:hypothetical protein